MEIWRETCLFGDGQFLYKPNGIHANAKLLPSLRLLRLKGVIFLNDEHWGYLTTFLAHQTSDGQNISLEMVGNLPYVGPGVMDKIMGLVKEFDHRENLDDDDDDGDDDDEEEEW